MTHCINIAVGIIASGIIGLYIGNFATNPIYRLPRNDAIFIRDPYCGDCNARLVRKDLYPVLSWLCTRGKCRYCGASVPGAYVAMEAFTGLLFIVCYLQYGFTEMFLLTSLGLTAFMMLAMMLLLDDFFSNMTLVTAIVFGMLYRTLADATIYGFASGAFAGLIVGAAVWKMSKEPLVRDVKQFPSYMKLLVAGGVWLGYPEVIVLFITAAVATLFRKARPLLIDWVIIITTAVLVLTRTLH